MASDTVAASKFESADHDMKQADFVVGSLLELRCAVAALGEKHHWWRSTFLSPTGLSFLQRIYPRTFVAAAVRSAAKAARVEHDARIGRGQVVHLFRLPPALERAIDDALRGWGEATQAKIREMLGAPDGPLSVLAHLAGGRRPNGAEGPMNCGSTSRLGETATTAFLAAQYLDGFEGGTRVYPYFEVGK